MVSISFDFMGINNEILDTLDFWYPKYLFEEMFIFELNLEVCRLERTCLHSWPSSTLVRSCVLGCSTDLHPWFW
jgi:hypothetical protein